MARLAAKARFRVRLRDLEDWLSTAERRVHFDWSHDPSRNINGKERNSGMTLT